MTLRKALKTNPAARYAARAGAGSAAAGDDPSARAGRNALVEAHLPQVRIVADRLLQKLPPSVDRDDLIGAGVLGLLEAVNRYDPARGVLFKTYAETRIRGAMLDSLRDLDWAPRALRHRARELELVTRELEQRLGRAAEEEEVAAALGVGIEEYHELLSDLRGLSVTDLETDDEEQMRAVPDDPALLPLAQYERTETRTRLAAAVDRLPERERQVIALYYHEELTMKEVGAVLGLTESRVSQLHTQAVIRLRSAMK
ncbi:MAG TPA: FliA/WhiG family RNA polymerase sigma factor [Blastocatellia bacterium]|nr:FliA/WhiG family RNA polymerase sigma factor [Blastocatellia bacterium]